MKDKIEFIQSLIGLFTDVKALSRGLLSLNVLPPAAALLRMSGVSLLLKSCGSCYGEQLASLTSSGSDTGPSAHPKHRTEGGKRRVTRDGCFPRPLGVQRVCETFNARQW